MVPKDQLLKDKDKSSRGHASQFFVAGELCRRGWIAVVTLGNTPNTDILCSDKAGQKFVHIQVKTFVPGGKTCSVGMKAENDVDKNFFWVLGGIPLPGQDRPFEYYVIPARVMAANTRKEHQQYLRARGMDGELHKDNTIRVVHLPGSTSKYKWDVEKYRDRWELIGERLGGD